MSENKQEPTLQEMMNNLNNAYQKCLRTVADLKDQLITAQDNTHKAYRDLVNLNEQYMLSVINTMRNEVQEKKVHDPQKETNKTILADK